LGTSIVIRNLDVDLERGLRLRAKANGRTIEVEAEEILRQALSEPLIRSNPRDLGYTIHARFAAIGGIEMQQPRSASRNPTNLFE
jgi:antitoxin FitA